MKPTTRAEQASFEFVLPEPGHQDRAEQVLGSELTKGLVTDITCLQLLYSRDAEDVGVELAVQDNAPDVVAELSGRIATINQQIKDRQIGHNPIAKRRLIAPKGEVAANADASRDAIGLVRESYDELLALVDEKGPRAMEATKSATAAANEIASRDEVANFTALSGADKLQLVDDMLAVTRQFRQAGAAFPSDQELKDVGRLMGTQANLLYNEVLARVSDSIGRRMSPIVTRNMQRGVSLVELLQQNNLVSHNIRRVYSQSADLQELYPSPDSMVQSFETVTALFKAIDATCQEGSKAVEVLFGIRSDLTGTLLETIALQVATAEMQISQGQAQLSELGNGPDSDTLRADLQGAQALVDDITANLEMFAVSVGGKKKVVQASKAGGVVVSAEASVVSLPNLYDTPTSDGAPATSEALVTLDPSVASSLRLARRILKGGVKLEKNSPFDDMASRLLQVSVENRKGNRDRLLQPHESGMMVAILADRVDTFIDLVRRVQGARQTHDRDLEAASRGEWTAEVSVLSRLDLSATLSRIHTIVTTPGLRNRLVNVIPSSADIERVRARVTSELERV